MIFPHFVLLKEFKAYLPFLNTKEKRHPLIELNSLVCLLCFLDINVIKNVIITKADRKKNTESLITTQRLFPTATRMFLYVPSLAYS